MISDRNLNCYCIFLAVFCLKHGISIRWPLEKRLFLMAHFRVRGGVYKKTVKNQPKTPENKKKIDETPS